MTIGVQSETPLTSPFGSELLGVIGLTACSAYDLLLTPYAVLPMIATRFAACAGRLRASLMEAWVSGTQ